MDKLVVLLNNLQSPNDSVRVSSEGTINEVSVFSFK